MKILGIDSSGMAASVAVLADDVLAAEFTVNNKKTHSQTLLPMLDQAVKMSGIALEELDGIAVASGPGSFTGLRIGASTAKGLGLALDKPLVAVPTLAGLAYQLAEAEGLICPVMDARRDQVYTAVYRMEEGRLTKVLEQQAIDIWELLGYLNQYSDQIHFLGDGVPVYQDAIRRGLKGSYDFAPAHRLRQSAAAIAALGAVYFQEGRREKASEFRPVYLRPSQAERERAERLHED